MRLISPLITLMTPRDRLVRARRAQHPSERDQAIVSPAGVFGGVVVERNLTIWNSRQWSPARPLCEEHRRVAPPAHEGAYDKLRGSAAMALRAQGEVKQAFSRSNVECRGT